MPTWVTDGGGGGTSTPSDGSTPPPPPPPPPDGSQNGGDGGEGDGTGPAPPRRHHTQPKKALRQNIAAWKPEDRPGAYRPATQAHPTAALVGLAHRHGQVVAEPDHARDAARPRHERTPRTERFYPQESRASLGALTAEARKHEVQPARATQIEPATRVAALRHSESKRLQESPKSETRARELDAIREELIVDEHGRAHLRRVRDELRDGPPNRVRRLELRHIGTNPPAPRAAVVRDGGHLKHASVSRPSHRSKHPAVDRGAHQRTVAADRHRFLDYALRFGQHYNRKYEISRGTWGAVDDCTNFVSQALHFGGWREDKAWGYQKVTYIPDYAGGGFPARVGGASAAWENVNQFVHYAVKSGRAEYLVAPSRRDIRPGDILVIDWHGGRPGTKDFHPDHLDIVTRVGDVGGKRQVYVASHGGSPNTDHTHFPFFKISGVTSDSQQQREPRVKFAVLRPTWK